MQAAHTQDLSAAASKALQVQMRLDYPELTERELDQLWEAIAGEYEQSEANLCLLNNDLPTLWQVKHQRLQLSDYLWGDNGHLAAQLTAIAAAMPTAPEFLLTTLIAAAGSRLGAGTQIAIKPSAGYIQPAIYRALIVATTGCKKTPTQSIILKPLEVLEAEAFTEWQTAQTAYQRALDIYRARSKHAEALGEWPLPPAPRKRYLVGDSTIDARGRIHQENPRGFLIYQDEGSAHFTHRNRSRSGLRSDIEVELAEFNGGPLTRDRKFESLFVGHSAISRTGTIQWETLASLMKHHDDTTGEWARWLFCAAPAPPAKIDLLSTEADMAFKEQVCLKKLYQTLERIEPQSYQLSQSAKAVFQTIQHRLIDWMQEENHPGLKAAYPKFESYLARLALWLHVVNGALGEKCPAAIVSDATMSRAGQLTEYFVGQLRLIYAHNSPQQQLTGTLLRMQAFAETKGRPIETREFKMGVWSLRKCSPAEIKTHLSTLVQAGYGSWVNGKYQAMPLH